MNVDMVSPCAERHEFRGSSEAKKFGRVRACVSKKLEGCHRDAIGRPCGRHMLVDGGAKKKATGKKKS
jgi:hypothetical protein